MTLAATLIEKAKLRWLGRRQHDSLALRRHFSRRYRIDVGLYSYGCFDRWRMPGPIRVGRYCSIANTVRSAPINHPLGALTTHPALYEKRFGVVDRDISWDTVLVIEDDVWIGHNAILLPGCKFVGRGSVVGAGAIVTSDVPPYTIVAGNPAKVMRRRFDDALIEAVEASRWWELDPPALRILAAERPEMLHHPTVQSLADWARARQG